MTPPGRRIAEARLALILLTRLPAGRLADPVPPIASAAWAFPLVGLVVGVIGWAAQAGALALGLGAVPAALLALGAMILATGALHLDGLADLADGLGGGRDRVHALEIMRDSRIGTYGALALILAVGLGAAALSRSEGGAPPVAFLLAAVASRLAMTAAIVWLPAARSDGLGQDAAGISWAVLVPGALVCGALIYVAGPGAVGALVGAAAAAGIVAWRSHERLGGQTGDVLGAVQVSAEIVCLLALSAARTG
ncbi:MAG: adenosylcobinamide-GDP ribazoletransferase [Alphaproteobacteria bacterium]|nr:adenosylcobinamide-GDP ribazoletransferase [Alphaproteobacteria bacterium]